MAMWLFVRGIAGRKKMPQSHSPKAAFKRAPHIPMHQAHYHNNKQLSLPQKYEVAARAFEGICMVR